MGAPPFIHGAKVLVFVLKPIPFNLFLFRPAKGGLRPIRALPSYNENGSFCVIQNLYSEYFDFLSNHTEGTVPIVSLKLFVADIVANQIADCRYSHTVN